MKIDRITQKNDTLNLVMLTGGKGYTNGQILSGINDYLFFVESGQIEDFNEEGCTTIYIIIKIFTDEIDSSFVDSLENLKYVYEKYTIFIKVEFL